MIYLAPIHGYTDCTFRNTYAKFFSGIDAAIAPFVPLVDGKVVKPVVVKDLLPESNTTMPVIPQVMGYKTGQFILMGNTLHDMGYTSVNWNLGCPMRRIARKKRGSGLLPFPELIEQTLEEVIPNIPIKISVKVRLGYADPKEIFRLIPILNRFPLDSVIVHPRLGTQMYTGQVDLDAYGKCLDAIEHPVVYNGDINDVDYIRVLKNRFPETRAWMLGRGVLSDFYLPARIQGQAIPCRNEQQDNVALFHAEFLDEMDKRWVKPVALLNKTKEYWLSFSKMYKNHSEIFMRLRLITEFSDMRRAILKIVNSEELA